MSLPIKRGRRGGFSLIEILVVLAIFGLSMAVIMPSTSKMLDQATSHAVFFEFQRQVSDMRREANRTGMPIRLVDPSAPEPATSTGEDRTAVLREPWRYTIAPAMLIADGGICSPTTVNLINGDRVVMTLRSRDDNCQFMRQQLTEEPPPEPSSQK